MKDDTSRQCAHLSEEDFRKVDQADCEFDKRDSGARTIGGHTFRTVKEAKSLFKVMRAAGDYEPHQDFLEALAKNHPDFYTKVIQDAKLSYRFMKSGQFVVDQTVLRHTEILKQPYWTLAQTTCLRIDDCLQAGTHRDKVASAARFLVMESAPTTRNMVCGVCGEVARNDDVHWDHYPFAFKDIFKEWRVAERLLSSEISVTKSINRFDDSSLGKKWRSFHDYHASFRPTHSQCNLRDKSRQPFRLSAPLDYDSYLEGRYWIY